MLGVAEGARASVAESIDKGAGVRPSSKSVSAATANIDPNLSPDAAIKAAVAASATQQNSTSPTAGTAQLATSSDWKAVQDGNGSTYYWNTKTNETSWEIPFAVPVRASWLLTAL